MDYNKINKIQTALLVPEFNLDTFLNLIGQETDLLIPANDGVVIEWIDKDEIVYRVATGQFITSVGLRVPRNKNFVETFKDNINSVISIPIVFSNDVIGHLNIISDTPNAFNQVHKEIAEMMAAFIASGYAHEIAYAYKIEHENPDHGAHLKQDLSHRDPLTSLANRAAFNEYLFSVVHKTKQLHGLFCLMILDIDHYKSIKDKYDPETAHFFLQCFATRLKKCVRDYDMVAHLDNDQFTILLTDMKSENDATYIAKKIISAVSKKFKLKDNFVEVTVSIGIVFNNDGNLSGDELIKQADQALKCAKAAGRDTYWAYHQGVGDNRLTKS